MTVLSAGVNVIASNAQIITLCFGLIGVCCAIGGYSIQKRRYKLDSEAAQRAKEKDQRMQVLFELDKQIKEKQLGRFSERGV